MPRVHLSVPIAIASLAMTLPLRAAAADTGAEPAKPARGAVLEHLATGTPSAALRYRFEMIDDQLTPENAYASTVRLALGYRTRPLYHLSLFAEFEGVAAVGPALYRIPTIEAQNIEDRPVIPDPLGAEINQAYARFDTEKVDVTVGRQEIVLNNGRLISAAAWRQNNQTFDAARLDLAPVPGLEATYAFVIRANRVVGPLASDGAPRMMTHLANVGYRLQGRGGLAAYGVVLDYDDELLEAASTMTFGARLSGPWEIGKDFSIQYAGEFAWQLAGPANPEEISARYYLGEAGVGWKGLTLRGQVNVREGFGPLDKFSTPLSHPWDGWVEKFYLTPDDGLRVLQAALTGPVPGVKGLSVTLIGYDYSAADASQHYGQEIDAGFEYRFVGLDRQLLVGSRFGLYQADELYDDTTRASLYTAWSF